MTLQPFLRSAVLNSQVPARGTGIFRPYFAFPHHPTGCQIAFQDHHASVGIRHQSAPVLKPCRFGPGFRFACIGFVRHDQNRGVSPPVRQVRLAIGSLFYAGAV